MLVQCDKISNATNDHEISTRTGRFQISQIMQILAIIEHETKLSCTCLAQNFHTKKTCLDSLWQDFPQVIYINQYFMQNSNFK